ncbi:Zn-ribbon domain-containing OB-fold protein [Nocardia sp. CA-151230]|uniref:Zn-ribbon domain-containing OB-fold protein n=1 Tax=Nocardia sp. CA-151230 TaxID=3239982 RepID=UPI003D8F09F5
MEISGPPIVPDERSAEFFAAAAEDRLVIRHCRNCAHLLGLEARTCSWCGSGDLEWWRASGAGQLVTWSVVHHPPHPAFAAEVPFPIGMVELVEGPWLTVRLAGVPLSALRIGLPMRAAFVHPAEGDSYPVFVPEGEL